MDMEVLKIGILIINMLMTVALWLFAFNSRKEQATNKSIKDLELSVNARFDAKCQRLAKVEARLEAAPNREELIRIHERIDSLNDGISQTTLLIGQVLGQVKQMNEYRK